MTHNNRPLDACPRELKQLQQELDRMRLRLQAVEAEEKLLRSSVHQIEQLNQVSLVIERSKDLDEMIRDVMTEIRQIFQSDRAFLLHPFHPEAASFRVPIEVTVPEWPGAFAMGIDVPMDQSARLVSRIHLETEEPLIFTQASSIGWDPELMKQFGIQSQMSIAIRPRIGKPWMLGVHQCSYVRVWTKEEQRLFKSIALRIRDAFSNLLYYQELLRSEEKYRTVVDSIHEVILQTDANGRLTFVNHAWTEMTSYSETESLGSRFLAYFSAEDEERLKTMHAQLLKQKKPACTFEALMSPKVGPPTWVEGHLHLNFNEKGQYAGVYITLIDISERKEAEAARAEVRAAKELDQLKTAFVNAISHDLRTPLTSILGYAEFLEDELGGPLSHDQQAFVLNIKKSAHGLENLVNDLLDNARLEAGVFKLKLEEVDMGSLVQEIVESLQPQAQEGGLSIEVVTPASPLRVQLDGYRIGRVFTNLLSNAIKFTPKRGRIHVRTRIEGDQVYSEVEDSGIAISPEDQAKLFQQFSQLTGGLKKGGTGLGLHISKSIVEAHGGRIGVRSEVGTGNTFWFSLPLDQPKSEPNDQ